MRIIETAGYQRMKREALFGLMAPPKTKQPPVADHNVTSEIAKNKANIDRLTTQLNIAKRENPGSQVIKSLMAQIEQLRDKCSELMALQYSTIGQR